MTYKRHFNSRKVSKMGPLARLIKSIFGKKKPVEEVKPIVDLRDVKTEEAVKEANQGKFATQEEVDAVREKWQSPVVEYTPPVAAVAKPIVKDVPVKAAVPVAKPAPVVHHKSNGSTYYRDDDDSYIDVSSVAAITAISSDFSDYSSSTSTSSCDYVSSSSNDYSGSSSSYDSGSSSSCDSSRW